MSDPHHGTSNVSASGTTLIAAGSVPSNSPSASTKMREFLSPHPAAGNQSSGCASDRFRPPASALHQPSNDVAADKPGGCGCETSTSRKSSRSSEAPGASSRSTPPKLRMRTASSWETSTRRTCPSVHLDREFLHGMGQPQPRGLGVIGRHAQVSFDQRVQFVEQMRIHADAGRDGEEAGAAIAFKVGIFHAAQGNAPGLCCQRARAAPDRGKRQIADREPGRWPCPAE